MRRKKQVIFSLLTSGGMGLHWALSLHCLAAAPPPQPIPMGRIQKSPKRTAQVSYDTYILGPGDTLQVELLDVPELSGSYSIGPDGIIYIPRLRAIYVEGLTIEEFRYFLNQQFKAYVRNPSVYVRPIIYRPIRVYVGGEVRRPGYYYLSGPQAISDSSISEETIKVPINSGVQLPASLGNSAQLSTLANGILQNLSKSSAGGGYSPGNSTAGIATSTGMTGLQLPTVFDAIRAGLGVTTYSDLASVSVTRKRAESAGGGKVQANLDFLRLLTQGDESQNIRLYDGDIVTVKRSTVELRDQVIKAAQTNLSPSQIDVFVSGRVRSPGAVTLPQGSNLNQAIIAAGGPQILRGPVEFVRFTREGTTDRRQFNYAAGATTGDYKNPILMAGDIVRIQETALSAGISVMNELTGPLLGVYSLYRIFTP